MSYTYGFFDAVDLGGGNYDRVYSSAEFSHYWALLVGDGVFGQPSTSLNVLAITPVAMSIKVSPGTGWIKGHYLTVPDNMDEVIAVPVANPSLPRIDSIIMALNNTDRDMKLYVRSGTAAASPKPVTLQRDADVWELELAQITVAAGAGNITQTAIKDMRPDPNRCGIVTGLIDQFDVSGFFTAAQASFNEWFADVQNQLGDDVAGNLLNLIQGLQDSKLDVSAKASTSEATTGTDDTKYMTPLKVSQTLDSKVAELWAIGDIRTSGRNLEVLTSGKYFQCNGRVFSSTTYPALNQAIGGRFGYQGYRKNIHTLFTNTSDRNVGMSSEALNDDGTQLLIGYSDHNVGYMAIISLPDMTLLRTYNLGNNCYSQFVFWSEGYPYALTQDSSGRMKIFRGNIGETSLAEIFTRASYAAPTVLGSTRIGNTIYLLWRGYSSNTSNSGVISIFGITGTSVSDTIVYSVSDSSWGTYQPMFVVGDTAYFGGTLKQTKVNAISLVAISNPEVTKFINFGKNHKDLPSQVGMPDGSMIACSDSGSISNMPNSIATLSSSLSYQEYSVEWDYHYNLQTSGSLDAEQNAKPEFNLSLVDGKPLLMVVFYYGDFSAWSCAALMGSEVDGAIRVMSEADPVPFSRGSSRYDYGGIQLPSSFHLTSGSFLVFLWQRYYDRYSSTTYYDGIIGGLQLQVSNPKIPESRGTVGPSIEFIRTS